MNRYLTWIFLLVLSVTGGHELRAQQSSNTVKFRVTYDPVTQTYTAWVVPDYATPNTNNLGTSELVSTAQFTLKVPSGFVIQNITDASANQIWDKTPAKLGPGLSLTATNGSVFTQDYSPATLDPNFDYYVIGKSPSESNLGSFVVGQPVALFTFKGNGCFGPIQPLPPGDPFIQAALDAYSFNVPNSFYSSSGQSTGGNQDPLEQFINISGAPANCVQNLAPIVTPDIANTNVNTPVSGNVLTNDVDPQGGPLTASLISQPGAGTVVMSPTGSYTYTPPANFTGTTSFCYSASNTATLSASTCVTINVNPDPSPIANNRPIANNDATQTTQGVPVTVAVLANDTDPDSATSVNGQLANPTLVSQPSVGTAVVNANGTVTYTPPANFTGVVSFPYQVCDKATPALCTTALVSVNVLPTPPANTTLAPVAVDDALITKVNTPKSGNVSTNDSDPQGLPLTYTTGHPTSGTVVMSPTGSYTYTPAPGYVGPDSFTYNVCNSAGKCDKATVSVDVQKPIDTPPVVIGEPVVTDKGKPVVLCLPITDPDVGDSHTATICGQPGSGTAAVSVNNVTHVVCLTYTPTSTFEGATTVCVQVCDAAGLCTNVILPITVIPTSPTAVTPQAPVVVVEPIVTPKDVPVTVCIDIKDPNLTDTHSVSVCSSPSKGSTTAVVNNTTHELCVTYKPSSGSVGQDAICLTVCDQTGLCTTVTVPVTIVDPTPPGLTPKPPIVTPTPIVTVVDRPVEVCTGISDNAGDTHTASICGQPASGTVSVGVDNATHKVCVSYSPGSSPVSTTVCVQVCDQGGLCTNVILPITVLPVNTGKAPVVTPDINNTNVNTPVSGKVLTNDLDPQGGPLTASVIGPLNGGGSLAFGTDGSYTYTPPTGFTGVASFCYSASNTAGLSASTCVTINVNPDPSPIANNRPIANNDATQTTSGVPVTVAVLANDTDPDSATSLNGQLANPTLVSQPSVGTAVVNANGTVTYTPPANFTGVVSFPYQVCDKATPALCTTALVSVNVLPTPPANTTLAPVAVDDALLAKKDTPSTGNVSTNDSDPQGLPLTYTTGQPTSGTVVMSPTGSYTYTPAPGYVGPDSFTYNVCNSAGKCDVATVSVDVQKPAAAGALTLQLKVMLQGALIGGSNGLMRDDLRSKGFLPLTEPYSAIGGSRFTHVNGGGGETMPASVTIANAGTGNAIVDWVFVELRSPSNLSAVVATHAALVQRDGDVVLASDGVSPLSFSSLTAGSYYVSVKHRNHLGAMTATAIPLSTTGTVVDFTTMTNAQLWNTTVGVYNYDNWEQTTVSGKQALWAGDANHDGKVKYQGTANDLIPIFSEVIGNQAASASPVYNYDNAFGYYFGDVNMDGKVKYQGTSNDTSLIFTNVLTNYQTLNSGQLYNFDWMLEQIP